MATKFRNLIRLCTCLIALAAPFKTYGFAVSTASTWATEAAIDILKRGGTATDAAIAAAFVLNVAQPYNSGIGGGGFFLAARQSGQTYFWDHRETAPSSAHAKMFLDPDGKTIPYYPQRVSGGNPVGVPGVLSGLHEAHQKLGKLSWKTLLVPAIRLAQEGIPVSPKFEWYLSEEWDRIAAFPATAALFGDKSGGHLKMGALLRQPLLAQTLKRIAQHGPRDFYDGELARSWLAEANKLGVNITADDLKKYKTRSTKPISFEVFGLQGLTADIPSASAVMVAAALRYLERYYRTHDVPDAGSAKRLIVTIETLKFFQNLRNTVVADKGSAKIDAQAFLNSTAEQKLWLELDQKIAIKLDSIETKFTQSGSIKKLELAQTSDGAQSSHTTHISVVDDQGLAVSYTSTIEQWFGSGLLVPGHGFLLNNELSDFSEKPDDINAPAAGKRPRSNMSPLIFRDASKKIVGVVGCAGGARIPSTLVEVLENYFIHKMSARQAMMFTRVHPAAESIEIEAGLSPKTVDELKAAGYALTVVASRSTAQALLRRNSKLTWEAATEPRSDGLGIAWQ